MNASRCDFYPRDYAHLSRDQVHIEQLSLNFVDSCYHCSLLPSTKLTQIPQNVFRLLEISNVVIYVVVSALQTHYIQEKELSATLTMVGWRPACNVKVYPVACTHLLSFEKTYISSVLFRSKDFKCTFNTEPNQGLYGGMSLNQAVSAKHFLWPFCGCVKLPALSLIQPFRQMSCFNSSS